MSDHAHAPQSLLSRVFSTDHKVIARQYLYLGLVGLLVAGLFALMIRWQLAYPGDAFPVLGNMFWSETGGVMPPEFYNMLFTMHGAMMVFFAITPIVIGAFGNFAIPLQLGAEDMAFPFVNMLSFWVMFLGAVIMAISFFMPGGAAGGGWTAYPPLSGVAEYGVGHGQTLWLLGIAFAGTSSLLGSVNYVVTTLNMRCEGMTLMRMPLTIWGLFCTAVLNLLWIPVVAAALFMVFMDRTAGTAFFLSGPGSMFAEGGSLAGQAGGQPLLFQHLFWGFGHPEVYILIFPVWGLVGDLLSTFSRKPAFGYKATVLSMLTILFLSQIVWGHHMFTSGMSPLLGTAFTFLTITISVPTAVFFLNWLGTIWRGSLRFTPPMLFALGVVFVFGIGGLTGLFLALQALDIWLHDTYFVVGHFHFTLAASVFFGTFAGIYYWFPKMFGKSMNQSLGKLHFYTSFVSLTFVFFMMMYIGATGAHPRRIADPSAYNFLTPFLDANVLIGWGSQFLGLVQLIFVWNFVTSLMSGEQAPDNPWEASSLEWVAPTPPPHGNFPVAPTVYRGPHEFNAPETGERGWLTQAEPSV
ncbi:MAG: cytochrome-c oxidase [Planctomycetes bacterium]|nr:cytochrome-c oxidase [Planctomycetota bacterium]